MKTPALLALLPAVALAASTLATAAASAAPAAPAAKPKPRKPPIKKPPEPVTPTPADPTADKPTEPPLGTPSPTAAGGGAGGSSAGTGTGGGSGDPAAKPAEPEPEPSARPAGKPGDAPDVDSLRQEYLSLRDELFKSRARANAVASQLYSTRIQIKLTYTTGRFYNPAKSSIRLDGASVYEDGSGAIAGDDGIRFDGYVAPGRHLITFRVEATGKDDDTFTSATENQIVVKAIAGKDLLVAARAKDTGDIAYEWKRSEKGSYGLGIDVAIKTAKAVDAAAPAPGAKK